MKSRLPASAIHLFPRNLKIILTSSVLCCSALNIQVTCFIKVEQAGSTSIGFWGLIDFLEHEEYSFWILLPSFIDAELQMLFCLQVKRSFYEPLFIHLSLYSFSIIPTLRIRKPLVSLYWKFNHNFGAYVRYFSGRLLDTTDFCRSQKSRCDFRTGCCATWMQLCEEEEIISLLIYGHWF